MTCHCAKYQATELYRRSISKRIQEYEWILTSLLLLAENAELRLKLLKCPDCGQYWQTGHEWSLRDTEYAVHVPEIEVGEWLTEPYTQPAAMMRYTARMRSYFEKSKFEEGVNQCRIEGCKEKAIRLSACCQLHHIEQLQRAGILPERPPGKLFPPYSNAKTTRVKHLSQAVLTGDIQAVRDFLKQGANVDLKRDGAHGTLITTAAAYGHTEIVEVLLDAGAEVNFESYYENPLSQALCHDYIGIVELLLKRGAHPTGAALGDAARRGSSEIVRLLLKYGAPVDGEPVNGKPSIVWTPLLCAVDKGRADCVKILIEHGANVNARTKAGNTALGLATHKGHERIAAMLKAAGAQFRQKRR